MAVLLLTIHQVLIERVGVDQVRCLDPVQDHVHDTDDLGEALFVVPIEGAGLQGLIVRCRVHGGTRMVIGFAEEACRADRAVIDRFAYLGGRSP